jgi:putative peptidoglycan lipid II flippase
MGVVLFGGAALLGPFLATPMIRYAALALLVAIGMAAYFGFGQLLGAFRLAEFRRAVRR